MLGPFNLMPFDSDNRSYVFFEGTPMYLGVGAPGDSVYVSDEKVNGQRVISPPIARGGFVESFAFDSPGGPGSKYSSGGVISVPGRNSPFSLNALVGSSSYFLGGALASDLPKGAAKNMNVQYYVQDINGGASDSVPPTMSFADGGVIPLVFNP